MKVWNAVAGRPIKLLTNVTDTDSRPSILSDDETPDTVPERKSKTNKSTKRKAPARRTQENEITDDEITAMELNDTHRKVIVGSHSGKIVMLDTLSGSVLKHFCSHKREITALYYVCQDKILISASWDRKILFHNDAPGSSVWQKKKGVIKVIKNAHNNDISTLDYHGVLDLVASGSRDCQVRVWEYETCKLEAVITGH